MVVVMLILIMCKYAATSRKIGETFSVKNDYFMKNTTPLTKETVH